MSTLTINVEWLESMGEPIQQAQVEVFCSDVIKDLNFTPDGDNSQEVESAGICKVTAVPVSSDVEVEFKNCNDYINMIEDHTCDAVAVSMYVGVPAYTTYGLGVMILAVFLLGSWKLLRG